MIYFMTSARPVTGCSDLSRQFSGWSPPVMTNCTARNEVSRGSPQTGQDTTMWILTVSGCTSRHPSACRHNRVLRCNVRNKFVLSLEYLSVVLLILFLSRPEHEFKAVVYFFLSFTFFCFILLRYYHPDDWITYFFLLLLYYFDIITQIIE